MIDLDMTPPWPCIQPDFTGDETLLPRLFKNRTPYNLRSLADGSASGYVWRIQEFYIQPSWLLSPYKIAAMFDYRSSDDSLWKYHFPTWLDLTEWLPSHTGGNFNANYFGWVFLEDPDDMVFLKMKCRKF